MIRLGLQVVEESDHFNHWMNKVSLGRPLNQPQPVQNIVNKPQWVIVVTYN